MVKKTKQWLFFLGLFLHLNAGAQTLRRPIAASYTGLIAYSRDHVDVFSFTANPASLAQLKNASVGVYGERRFLLKELALYTAAIGLPTRSGNFGWKAGYYGFSDYNETQLGLAYARKLGEKADAGLQFNYNGISMAGGYGNAAAMSVALGVVLHISEKLQVGIHAADPMGGKFGKDHQERLSSVYSFGAGYDASEKFFISLEIEKEEDRPVNVNAGMQYQFVPRLWVRAGIATATSSEWIGLGLMTGSFRVDVVTSFHPQLGITPGLLLLFDFKKTSK